jgi:hypothetical protein
MGLYLGFGAVATLNLMSAHISRSNNSSAEIRLLRIP